MTTVRATGVAGSRGTTRRRILLWCGIVYGVVYVVSNDVVAAVAFSGYSRLDQAVSELSALSAPPRPFLIAMLPVYTGLMVAFGVGVWQSAFGSRALRTCGALVVAFGVTGVLWLPFPMSAREDMVGAAGMSVNDVGHHIQSAKLTEGGPTPYLGLYERVGLGAYLLWFAVLAAILLRTSGGPSR